MTKWCCWHGITCSAVSNCGKNTINQNRGIIAFPVILTQLVWSNFVFFFNYSFHSSAKKEARSIYWQISVWKLQSLYFEDNAHLDICSCIHLFTHTLSYTCVCTIGAIGLKHDCCNTQFVHKVCLSLAYWYSCRLSNFKCSVVVELPHDLWLHWKCFSCMRWEW